MIRRLNQDDRGTAAVEMALITPMLLILMMGAFELGNYFLSEHVLVKAVRDGAVYAARQDIPTYYNNCPAGGAVSSPVDSDTKNIVRSGQLGGGSDRLPNWASATFSVSYTCTTSAGGTTMSGMYSSNNGDVPKVTVSAQVPYRTLLGSIGVDVGNFTLGAREEAVVTGR